MPTPMKLNAASVKMASGIPNVRETIIGVRAFGSKWYTIIARSPRANSPRRLTELALLEA